jgi:hypothetical protein
MCRPGLKAADFVCNCHQLHEYTYKKYVFGFPCNWFHVCIWVSSIFQCKKYLWSTYKVRSIAISIFEFPSLISHYK